MKRPAASRSAGVAGTSLTAAKLYAQLPRTILGENLSACADRYGKDNFDQVKAMIASFGPGGLLGLCAVCSGTNMLTLVMLALLAVCKMRLKLFDAFNSEIDESKQAFGNFVGKVTCVKNDKTHTFSDMTLLGGKTSPCVLHGEDTLCNIPGSQSEDTTPKPFLGACGISCLDFSNLSRGSGSATHTVSHIYKKVKRIKKQMFTFSL
jgi:hypothetical protein